MVSRRKNLKDRIISKIKINEETDCWEWQGCKTQSGYGQVFNNGKMMSVHRIMSNAPDSMYALHHCDNPCCCNPDHLYIGNGSDNANDMYNRKRHPRNVGSLNGSSKLTEHDVYGIKILLKNKKEMRLTDQKIANIFSVNRVTISDISQGRAWRHVRC